MAGIQISIGAECPGNPKPIGCLFADSEVTGGVRGINRLGGNFLLEYVVLTELLARVHLSICLGTIFL
jgi:succinate dehydrogenase/fumarate reductase flavoprotein subunit